MGKTTDSTALELTADEAVGRVARHVETVQPADYQLVVQPETAEQVDGYWWVQVRPDRPGVLGSDLHHRLNRIEELLADEGIHNVFVRSTIPPDDE